MFRAHFRRPLLLILTVLFLAAAVQPSQAQRRPGDPPPPGTDHCDCDLERTALENAEATLADAQSALDEAGAALAEAEGARDEAAAAVDAIILGLQDIDGVVGSPGDLPEGVPVGRFGLGGYGIDATIYFPADQSEAMITEITEQLEQAGIADAVEAAKAASKAVDLASEAFEAARDDLTEAEETRNTSQRLLDECLEECA